MRTQSQHHCFSEGGEGTVGWAGAEALWRAKSRKGQAGWRTRQGSVEVSPDRRCAAMVSEAVPQETLPCCSVKIRLEVLSQAE